jgi:hypothetical protein
MAPETPESWFFLFYFLFFLRQGLYAAQAGNELLSSSSTSATSFQVLGLQAHTVPGLVLPFAGV